MFQLSLYKARIFLLVDLWDFFFRRRVGGRKKSSENDQLTASFSEHDQLTGHFQSFFFNISRTNSKTSKVTKSL